MLAFLTDKHCFLHTKCAKHRNYNTSIPQKDNTYLKNRRMAHFAGYFFVLDVQ